MKGKSTGDPRYGCSKCPGKHSFDRLKKNKKSNWSKSLQYHVEIEHSADKETWLDLKVDLGRVPRKGAMTEEQRLNKSIAEKKKELAQKEKELAELKLKQEA
ncbi:hypothetical protein H2198_009421 [Neophaeococcomyces mojaviensis]|uniref:Uncharacterized protein n=1 Tax=Neophaeococcomyces mojaviensis TaxID=3383035 RepID=A0ACC2ZUI0_9EURO|nr:hypothetical protein H2198_009421 [Knufia sp. JES_112]